MSKRFYGAWTLAVLLAVLLPIAVPYLVWPPLEARPSYRQGQDAERFGRWARARVEGTRLVPNSVDVEVGSPLRSPVRGCGPEEKPLPRVYTAKVTLRGPYGLPFSSFEVACSGDWSRVGGDEVSGLALGAVALLVGAVAVSVPFFPLWLRHVLSRRRL